MKECCADITGAGNAGTGNGLTEHGKFREDCGGLIPAGILIGLGLGLLADQAGSGFLIGLGSGLLGKELLPRLKRPVRDEFPRPGEMNVTVVLIGTFLILIGVCVIWAPAAIWPYSFAGFLILAGIWFLARELAGKS